MEQNENAKMNGGKDAQRIYEPGEAPLRIA